MCPLCPVFKPEDAGDQVDMLGGSSVDRGWWALQIHQKAVNQSRAHTRCPKNIFQNLQHL